MAGQIVIKGARVHNLKNIDLEIPRNKLVVFTGVSGSGKSSLAFDTLFAEGQRRYVESLSPHARHLLQQLERPDVDSIEGLSPAIAIEQKGTIPNPRSTVGTITEIYDFLRLLFARVGKTHCPRCGREIVAWATQQIVDRVLSFPPQSRVNVLAPVAAGQKGSFQSELRALARAGFSRVRTDGTLLELGDKISLDASKKHDIDLVVDRLVLREGIEKRLADSIESASRYGKEVVKVETLREGESQGSEVHLFPQKAVCLSCDFAYPEITPGLFSFNSLLGACPSCGGLGVRPGKGKKGPLEIQEARICDACRGTRLRNESLSVKFHGRNIAEISALPVGESLLFLSSLDLSPTERVVAGRILQEIISRLQFLTRVGVHYLSLDRTSFTLSGGEAQRIRLATQIGSSLVGVLYILDEPSIGLHPRDHSRLLETLRSLRDAGNTVLVVEHDRDTILAADYVVDLGPGSGTQGGEVMARGAPREIMRSERSLTGDYLAGRRRTAATRSRPSENGKWLILKGAKTNNLKGISVRFPIGRMTCVTGVSGSGKSSLVVDTLYRALMRLLHRPRAESGPHGEILGWKNFQRVINIDQAPIGRNPSSNAATYSGFFDQIRQVFAQLPEARVRGYNAGRFSFNVKGGRCEACRGDGSIRIEMHFLPDVFVTCELCKGRRYNRETLDIRYKGRSVADVLDLTVVQALEFLGNFPVLRQKLEMLKDVGLDYLVLGQSATALSGGESQRLKLALELSRSRADRTLYILDEPTTGLHFEDIKKLLEVLGRLLERGNTVIVIEHNLDVIGAADFIIDLGPEGGQDGGEIVAAGTPQDICRAPRSYTGKWLKRGGETIA